MSIIAWVVLGAIAGYLAGFLVKGDEGMGVIGHIVLGIVGALVGGFLAAVLFNSEANRRRARHELDRDCHDRRRYRCRRLELPPWKRKDGPRGRLAGRPAKYRTHPNVQRDAHQVWWASRLSPARTFSGRG